MNMMNMSPMTIIKGRDLLFFALGAVTFSLIIMMVSHGIWRYRQQLAPDCWLENQSDFKQEMSRRGIECHGFTGRPGSWVVAVGRMAKPSDVDWLLREMARRQCPYSIFSLNVPPEGKEWDDYRQYRH